VSYHRPVPLSKLNSLLVLALSPLSLLLHQGAFFVAQVVLPGLFFIIGGDNSLLQLVNGPICIQYLVYINVKGSQDLLLSCRCVIAVDFLGMPKSNLISTHFYLLESMCTCDLTKAAHLIHSSCLWDTNVVGP
jgi:hypothetical protein